MVEMYSLELVLVSVEMSVAQMCLLNVSVAVVAGADNLILLPYFGCC